MFTFHLKTVILLNITPMAITDEEQARHDLETKCHLCNKHILDMTDKVRNHLTGKVLGSLHSI